MCSTFGIEEWESPDDEEVSTDASNVVHIG